MRKITCILFDLDGTLTDPGLGIVNSVLFALAKLGIREEHASELHRFIGPPLHESFKTRYNLTDELTERAVHWYRQYYSEKGIFENEVYAGVTDLLDFLSSQDYRLFVATSKPTEFATIIIDHFGLGRYLEGVVGSNLDNTRTSKTEVISSLIADFDLESSSSAMVGDREHDIIGARNNSLISVAVTYGYGSLAELTSREPDFIVNDCLELKSLLRKRAD